MNVAAGIRRTRYAGTDYITDTIYERSIPFATSIAASVSAVSPLCDIAMTTSFSVTTGFEYLNSLAYSTVTGMRQNSQ